MPRQTSRQTKRPKRATGLLGMEELGYGSSDDPDFMVDEESSDASASVPGSADLARGGADGRRGRSRRCAARVETASKRSGGADGAVGAAARQEDPIGLSSDGSDVPLSLRAKRAAVAAGPRELPAAGSDEGSDAPLSRRAISIQRGKPAGARRQRQRGRRRSSSDEPPVGHLVAARTSGARGAARSKPSKSPSGQSFDYGGLPPDIMASILGLASAKEALPVAATCRSVCRSWRQAVADTPQVWRRLDMSYGWCNPTDRTLKQHIRAEAWAAVTHLNIGGCNKLTDKGLLHLSQSCPSLTLLNIAYCGSFSLDGIGNALSNLSSLACIDMSGISTKPVRKGAIDALLQVVSSSVGPRLETLTAEYCPHLSMKGIRHLLPAKGLAARDISNLKTLALSASANLLGRVSLPIEELQQGCPLLERLLLNGLGGLYGWHPGTPPARPPPGHPGAPPSFPHLLVAEVGTCQTVMTSGTQHGASYVTNEVLGRLLHGSARLEELDIGGSRVTLEGLQRIPESAPIRRLNMSRGSAACDECVEACAAMFGRTLEEVDASGAGNRITDRSLCALRTCGRLIALDASSSAISNNGVHGMLKSAVLANVGTGASDCAPCQLTKLNIASCRGVGRDLRTAASVGVTHLVRALRDRLA